ncbi:heat shock protein 9/12-domain-containing protein [Fimicolochytrium jonesii]|uniref:heat shock protein 9/12-domain-containing protein n=1 Tax=Fimicolochytrium jonesii TaxID=1396493 RepID=UPI0022FE2F17|nr:heat shock protein 9/12-domain-containing protein [Fimicolochytrium jonesii]KAI8818553.1 heat shock protein 9/12-domain-containing protein [Fimicolochytrium jonesii]
MSDLPRKDISTHLGEAAKPDSMKSTVEQQKEKATGHADDAIGRNTAQEHKGPIQKVWDKVQGNTPESPDAAPGNKLSGVNTGNPERTI